MLLNDLLDLALELGGDVASGDLLKELGLSGGQVSTELTLPASDLVDGDGVELGTGLVRR